VHKNNYYYAFAHSRDGVGGIVSRLSVRMCVCIGAWTEAFFKLPSTYNFEISLFAQLLFLWFFNCAFSALCLQCFDAVGWAAGRASGL